MLKINPLYQTTTPEQAKKHILTLIPIERKNQFQGLLNILQNSIIKEMQNQNKTEENSDQ